MNLRSGIDYSEGNESPSSFVLKILSENYHGLVSTKHFSDGFMTTDTRVLFKVKVGEKGSSDGVESGVDGTGRRPCVVPGGLNDERL